MQFSYVMLAGAQTELIKLYKQGLIAPSNDYSAEHLGMWS